MKNLFTRSINNILRSALKNVKRIAAVALVGLSLCGFAMPAQAANSSDFYQNERGQLQTTERYDQIQSNSGGMNGFNDTDPRRDTNGAKAKELSDTAERRNRQQTSDPLETVREAADNLTEKAADAVSDLTRN